MCCGPGQEASRRNSKCLGRSSLLATWTIPGGILLPRGSHTDTRVAIASGAKVIYGPTVVTERLVAASHILVRNGDAFDLYAVKATTDGAADPASDESHAYEIAFQALAWREADVRIGRLFLVRLRRSYVRYGDLNLPELFAIEDVTARVQDLLPTVTSETKATWRDLASSKRMPAPCGCVYKGRNKHCGSFGHINPAVPQYGVYDIARIGVSPKKLKALVDRGILELPGVPDDVKLSTIQVNQVAVTKSGQIIINRSAIAGFLGAIEQPASYLDYETYAAAVPQFDGYRPFDQIPFQFSAHIMMGDTLGHHEFLHTYSTCPDQAFIAALECTLPNSGSILVWNKTFEKTINSRLAARKPRAAVFLKGTSNNIDFRVDRYW